jgi:hypothetical protein
MRYVMPPDPVLLLLLLLTSCMAVCNNNYRNLGHTLNDIFNVWMMLWLEGLAPYARQVDLLNVDSFKLGCHLSVDPCMHQSMHPSICMNDQ